MLLSNDDMSAFLENESLASLARRLQSEMDIIDLTDLLVATDFELNEIADTLNLSMGQKLRFRKAIHNRRRLVEPHLEADGETADAGRSISRDVSRDSIGGELSETTTAPAFDLQMMKQLMDDMKSLREKVDQLSDIHEQPVQNTNVRWETRGPNDSIRPNILQEITDDLMKDDKSTPENADPTLPTTPLYMTSIDSIDIARKQDPCQRISIRIDPSIMSMESRQRSIKKDPTQL